MGHTRARNLPGWTQEVETYKIHGTGNDTMDPAKGDTAAPHLHLGACLWESGFHLWLPHTSLRADYPFRCTASPHSRRPLLLLWIQHAQIRLRPRWQQGISWINKPQVMGFLPAVRGVKDLVVLRPKFSGIHHGKLEPLGGRTDSEGFTTHRTPGRNLRGRLRLGSEHYSGGEPCCTSGKGSSGVILSQESLPRRSPRRWRSALQA